MTGNYYEESEGYGPEDVEVRVKDRTVDSDSTCDYVIYAYGPGPATAKATEYLHHNWFTRLIFGSIEERIEKAKKKVVKEALKKLNADSDRVYRGDEILDDDEY